MGTRCSTSLVVHVREIEALDNPPADKAGLLALPAPHLYGAVTHTRLQTKLVERRRAVQACAIRQTELTAMPRARDNSSTDLSVIERPAHVRARVFHGPNDDAISVQQHTASLDLHPPHQAVGNVG